LSVLSQNQAPLQLVRGEDGYLKVPKDWIPDNAIKQTHVKVALTNFSIRDRSDNEALMWQLMEKEKRQIKEYARVRIEHQMYLNAKQYNIRFGIEQKQVKNINEILIAYKEAKTEEQLRDFWYVGRGCFEQQPNYHRNMSTEYMAAKKWRYSERDIDAKLHDGFVKKLMTTMHREILRRFANNDRQKGGLKITRPKCLTNTVEEKRENLIGIWFRSNR
jgi:hypothetical protein